MIRQSVSSSNIRSVGYDGHTLEIEFHSGGVYQYSGVSEHSHQSLLGAYSKGGYFHDYIRDRFPTVKVG